MRKRTLAILCALALILGMIPASAPTAAAATTDTATTASTGEFKVGFAKICINPEDKDGDGNSDALPLGGYDNGQGRIPSNGQALFMDDNGSGYTIPGVGGTLYQSKADVDGLFATAIAMQDENGKIVIFIGMDAISNGSDMVLGSGNAQAKIEAAAKTAGYVVEHSSILINASHTHSGIYMSGGSTADDVYDSADYRKNLKENWLPKVAVAALNDMVPATIYRGSATTEGMNFVRHYNDADDNYDVVDVTGDNTSVWMDDHNVSSFLECDPNIYMLKFAREGNNDVVLANWRAHPKCNSTGVHQYGLEHRNYTSSDYINAFRYKLEWLGYDVAFFQGAAGNINTYSSTYLGSDTLSFPSGTSNAVSLDSRNPTNGETIIPWPYGSNRYGVSQPGYLYGQVLAADAAKGLSAMTDENIVSSGAIRVNTYTQTEYLDMSKKETYDEVCDITVAEALDVISDYNTLSASNISTAKSNWGTMTILEYLADYWDYVSDLQGSEDSIPTKTTLSNNVTAIIQKTYKINSKYHLNTIYAQRDRTKRQASFEINAIAIGDAIGFMTAPFEIFDCNYNPNVTIPGYTNNSLKGLNSSYGQPFVLGYTNRGDGYMPASYAFEVAYNGSYEVNQTTYERGTAERVAENLVDMLNDLQDQPDALPSTCPACGAKNVTWYNWEPYTTTVVPTGHYYLSEDYNSAVNWQKQVNGQICLHLNGHTFANSSVATGRAFVVNSKGVLNLIGTGVVQGQGCDYSYSSHAYSDRINNQYGGVIKVVSGGTVNQYAGVTVQRVVAATATQTAAQGGTVYVASGGKYNMYGGTITGGQTETVTVVNPSDETQTTTIDSCGGNVYNAGTFTMNSGSITGGSAYNGGNVYNAGTFTMNNGSITGGSAGHDAGSVYVGGSSKVTLNNGTISGGTATRYGGNLWVSGAFEMNGGTVSDGTANGSQSLGHNILVANRMDFNGGTVSMDKEGKNIRVNSSANLTVSGNATVEGGTISLQYLTSSKALGNLNVAGAYYGSAVVVAEGGAGTNVVLGTAPAGSAMKENSLTYFGGTYGIAISGTNLILTAAATPEDACQIINADGTEGATYTTVKEALENYDAANGGYIKLLADIPVDAFAYFTENAYVEMNGKNMYAAVASGVDLSGMETATDDYSVEGDTLGVLTVVRGTPAAQTAYGTNRYLALPGDTEGTYTFHCFQLDTKKGLRTYNAENGTGIYFEPAAFKADEQVIEVIDSGDNASWNIGVKVQLYDNSGAEKIIYVPINETDDAAGASALANNAVYRVAIYDLLPTNTEVSNRTTKSSKYTQAQCDVMSQAEYLSHFDLSEYEVEGTAYIMIGGEYILDTAGADRLSLQSAIKQVDAKYNDLGSAQKDAVSKMWANYSTAISSWFNTEDGGIDEGLINIGNIKIDISDWFN